MLTASATRDIRCSVHGYDIGIIVIKSGFVRIPGDVGNARTYPFPVAYRVLENVDLSML
jgi:hypothetical protein